MEWGTGHAARHGETTIEQGLLALIARATQQVDALFQAALIKGLCRLLGLWGGRKFGWRPLPEKSRLHVARSTSWDHDIARLNVIKAQNTEECTGFDYAALETMGKG